MSYSSDDDPLFWFLAMIGFGTYGFFSGFQKLRKKRAIENIPTSTIRGMAMGEVEITGTAEPYQLELIAPLTDVPCVYYKYQIEEKRGSGKHSHWVTIAAGDSCATPFFVRDETGRVLVSPAKAEMLLPKDLSTSSWTGSSTIARFMEQNGIKCTSFLGFHNPMRFSEWHICKDEPVYILGFAQKNSGFQQQREQALVQRLNELKNDAQAMKRFDFNNDGEISEDEWSFAVKQIEQDLIEKSMASTGSGEHADVIICYNPNTKIFLISDKSQKDLLNSMGWQILLYVWGGAALAVGGLFLTLLRLNLL